MQQGDKTYFNRDSLQGFVMALCIANTEKKPICLEQDGGLTLGNKYKYLFSKENRRIFSEFLLNIVINMLYYSG